MRWCLGFSKKRKKNGSSERETLNVWVEVLVWDRRPLSLDYHKFHVRVQNMKPNPTESCPTLKVFKNLTDVEDVRIHKCCKLLSSGMSKVRPDILQCMSYGTEMNHVLNFVFEFTFSVQCTKKKKKTTTTKCIWSNVSPNCIWTVQRLLV